MKGSRFQKGAYQNQEVYWTYPARSAGRSIEAIELAI